jgi:peptide/nickel transport system substrate-binding protein
MRYRCRSATATQRARRAVWFALPMAAALAHGGGAVAATLRWASEADAASLDPYTRDETLQLSLLGNIYEPLVRRGADLSLQPALAVAWERTDATHWTFHLRPGVSWQDGTPFTAADVVFSFARVRSPTSLLRSVTAALTGATASDSLTVELQTAEPDPILPLQLTNWYIMSQAWAEAHETTAPALLASTGEDFATRHAMGTGPFLVALRDPDHRTVLERNPAWWDTPSELVDSVEFDVLTAPTTRVAALVSGEVDVATAIPPQDAAYVARTSGLKLIAGPELRTIVLGMDQARDQLVKSDVKGRNPFRDARVRQAVALAIDEDAIAAKVMRGQARPAWLLWAPGVSGYDAALDRRPAPDPARARALLAEAGYPDGFGVTLDCPTDRYVMDEAICTALAPMLARVGIRLDVNAQPKARFFKEIGPPAYNTGFYLIGWTPPTYDALNVLFNLAGSRDGVRGAINFGGFSDPGIDRLIEQIGRTAEAAARDALIDEAARRLQAAFAYIPLHQQRLLWGAKVGVELPQSPDGALLFRLVRPRP